jgi:hypothetical protein
MLDLDNGGGGEYIRFKPSVNGWYVDGEEIDFKGFSVDPKSLRTGWGLIQEGEAPAWVWDEQVGVKGPRPEGEYKRGFSLMVYIKDYGWREWSSNGAGVNMGLVNIWKEIDAGMAKNKGKLAALKYAGSSAESIGKGSTRIPRFELAKWIDAPKDDAPPVTNTPPSQEVEEDDDALF